MSGSTGDAELLAMARTAAAHAYAPYSKFRVGAAVITTDGTVFDGANVENAAFPSTLCAEAVAIGSAIASGARTIDTVAVACLDGPGCLPCGQCRQRAREFGVKRVLVEGADGNIVVHRFEDLLPQSFGPEHLSSG